MINLKIECSSLKVSKAQENNTFLKMGIYVGQDIELLSMPGTV